MDLLRYRSAGIVIFALVLILSNGCSDKGSDPTSGRQLQVSPDLVFRQVEYSVSPSAQWVIVTSTGTGTVRYSARVASGNTWIGLFQQVSGIAPDSFLVNFQVGRTQAGTYYDTILVESPDVANSPVKIPVVLIVDNLLQVTPDAFEFSMTTGGAEPLPQKMALRGTSTTPIDLSFSHTSSWLTLDKAATSTPDTVTLTASGAGLTPGIYYDTIAIDAPTAHNPVNVPCSLLVASWLKTTLAQPRDLRDVAFVSSTRGFAIGALSDATGGGLILQTDDGGLTWKTGSVPSEAVGGVTFADQNNGWVVGTRYVYRTRNASADSVIWTAQVLPDSVNAVSFVDTTLGWLVGNDGYILHTTDGGAHWSQQNSGTAFSLAHVQFVSPDSGWAVGNNGVILVSSDSGNTWTPQGWGGTSDLYGLFFVDNMEGWVVGALGTILHTTNAGVTWTSMSQYTSANLTSIWVSPAGRRWAVGSHGTILFSPGGLTWSDQSSGVSTWLKGVFFLDDHTGWVVGEGGIILRTSAGGQ